MGKAESPGEREILRRIRALTGRPRTRAVRVGIGDDCAVLTPRDGEELVITTDFSIEDRHFRLAWHEPEAIGYKCLARGLSDIASMGARPVAAFVSLAVPKTLTQSQVLTAGGKDWQGRQERSRRPESWIDRFYRGLLMLAERENVTLAGGDLSESPSFAIADIIVVGAVPTGRALLRSGARAGDMLYVTGSLGGAVAELEHITAVSGDSPVSPRPKHEAATAQALDWELDHPHFYPQPRLAAGQALMRRKLATGCIDMSDGLSTDLLHLCEESKVSAEVYADELPLATWSGKRVTTDQALHGGDDYELLFTASPATRMPKKLGGIAIRSIGRMLPPKRGMTITLVEVMQGKKKRSPLLPQGWQHF